MQATRPIETATKMMIENVNIGFSLSELSVRPVLGLIILIGGMAESFSVLIKRMVGEM